MKKNLFSCIIGLLVLGFTTLAAAADPHLSLTPSPADGFPGGGVLIGLRLSGGAGGYAGMNARIILPKGVQLMGVQQGGLLSSKFAFDYRSFQGDSNNWCTVIAYSGTGAFRSPPGDLLILQLSVPKDATPGTYNISFAATDINPLINSKHVISNALGTATVAHTTTNGSITIYDGTDSDGDNIPDSYEIMYFGSLSRNGTGDFDKDGKPDIEEFYDGTDPRAKDIPNPPPADLMNLDIDGNGSVTGNQDGLLVMRYLMNYYKTYPGIWISGAVDTTNGTRKTAPEIELYIQSLMP
jgi:hypothetical protein